MKFWNNLKSSVNSIWFYCSGKRPWARGYGEYRQAQLERILCDSAFSPDRLPPGYGFRLDERIVEYPWLFARLPRGAGKLLDAGSVLNHEFLLSHERLSSKSVFVSTLAPEPVSFNSRGISYVYEDLRHCCFRDEYFDWVVSVSTIEHIGMDNTLLYTDDSSKHEYRPDAYLDAIGEFRRVLKPGGKLFLSMPFGRSKNYGWFQIFDAAMVDRLLARFSPAQMRELHFRYTPDGWTHSSRELSKDADYFDIHAGLAHAPDYAAASRAVVCLELTK